MKPMGEKSESFLRELGLGFLPHELVKTSITFVHSPKKFIEGVKAGDWESNSHPAAFLLATVALVAVVSPWLGPYSSEILWLDVFLELQAEDQELFQEVMDFGILEIASIEREVWFPGDSLASRSVRKLAGSLELDEIAIYLARENANLARHFVQKVDRLGAFRRYDGYLFAPLLAVAWSLGSLVLHTSLRQPGLSLRTTYYVTVYWQCLWLLATPAVVALRVFLLPAPRDRPVLGIIFVAVYVVLLVLALTQLGKLVGILYKRRSTLRRSVAIFGSLVTSLVAVVLEQVVFEWTFWSVF